MEMSTYIEALVARDPSKIRTASTLKYTENGVVTQLGTGLWKTASSQVPGERLDSRGSDGGASGKSGRH